MKKTIIMKLIIQSKTKLCIAWGRPPPWTHSGIHLWPVDYFVGTTNQISIFDGLAGPEIYIKIISPVEERKDIQKYRNSAKSAFKGFVYFKIRGNAVGLARRIFQHTCF